MLRTESRIIDLLLKVLAAPIFLYHALFRAKFDASSEEGTLYY
jgi:hypothetical protein